ncbi:MAG: PAS domain-containing protein [Alteromonadaceae bacterium]|nr:PAS domain-containing protein [Alteromonadaceae bacterium]
MAKKSLFWHLYLKLALLVSLQGAIFITALHFEFELWVSLLAATLLSLLVLAISLSYLLSPLTSMLKAVEDGVSAFKDGDFSLTIHKNGYREIENIAGLYNDLAGILRDERMNIFQRELLLDTVIQSTPVALILTNNNNHIVYSNHAARDLLGLKRRLEGSNFQQLLAHLPEELQQLTADKSDGLVTQIKDDQSIVYNVNCQQFVLNGATHFLYLYNNLTDEMSRKEIDMWKRVIRLISHELNNSLAPISSLSQSAKKIIDQPEHIHLLKEVMDTIGSRTQHLSRFIEQYAKFAKMPKPKLEQVELQPFCQHLQTLLQVKCEFSFVASHAKFDPAQLEQVLINLVKNARESGSAVDDIGLHLTQQANRLNFTVYDRGNGMTESQMQQALLPFYTTKEKGSGVGLALCNEIVNAHGGKLRLFNRDHGGLCVSFELVLS